jgi:predicted RNase H-like HicB family nuclease
LFLAPGSLAGRWVFSFGDLACLGDLARLVISGTMLAMKKSTKREFTVIVERDEDGYYVATVPELRGCHTQARSLDSLTKRVREAIAVCLEVRDESYRASEFIGIQRVAVWAWADCHEFADERLSLRSSAPDLRFYESEAATTFFGMQTAEWQS